MHGLIEQARQERNCWDQVTHLKYHKRDWNLEELDYKILIERKSNNGKTNTMLAGWIQ